MSKKPKAPAPKHREGDLKVWWIPQVPMKAFEVMVPSLVTAKVLLDALADYDLFQFENNIKPDYANTGGLIIFEDGEWNDWYSADGDQIDDLKLEYLVKQNL
jgi:hypothetical protein